jgi:hypothetical protein
VPVLVASLGVIAAIYLAVNLALLHAFGLAGLAGSKAPGAEVMARALGPVGSHVVALFRSSYSNTSNSSKEN